MSRVAAIKWGKASGGFVTSKCGKFQIFPIYGGMTRPESFSLSFTDQHGGRREIGSHLQNQREAKDEAARFCEDRRRYHGWKQPCPVDQFVAIKMAIEMDVDLLRTIGFRPDVERAHAAYVRLNSWFDQLRDLEPFLRKGAW